MKVSAKNSTKSSCLQKFMKFYITKCKSVLFSDVNGSQSGWWLIGRWTS